MTGSGATTTSSVVPGKVCFQAVAKLFSTAEMRRKAAIQPQQSSQNLPGQSADQRQAAPE
ncbi:hypothetical protein NKH36_26835 [Mesorhizobium sp. M1312]|uniref:hypothetical protein n=1 Tax=unclassified Mesorhizobium TaxID=325217 RepID=UPI00333DA4F4